jgi:hypothetical protein
MKMKEKIKKRWEKWKQWQTNQGSGSSDTMTGPLSMPHASYNHTTGSDPF